MPSPVLHLLVFRAELLALLTFSAALFGEPLARLLQYDRIATALHRFAATLERRLNRPERSTATRFYRGFIALALLVLPAGLVGALLWQDVFWWRGVADLLLVAMLGRFAASVTLCRRWRQAGQGKLLLEAQDKLFNDTHGVLRQIILESARRFIWGTIASGFWFVIGGPALMFAYLALALAGEHFSSPASAFGWGTARLLRLIECVPSVAALALLLLAGLFVPHAHPLKAGRAVGMRWYGMLAELLGISLGGPQGSGTGEAELPWQGSGTAKLEAGHLTTWLSVLAVATILWIALLALPSFFVSL